MAATPRPPASVPEDDEALIAAARAAQENAYSPYSGVRVGAALVADDGRVFSGCNVENASLGLTQCAERAALSRAVAEGARDFSAVVITSSFEEPLMPCGACRQVLREFAEDLRVVSVGMGGASKESTLGELLPTAFAPDDLRGGAR
ncbi:MAG: cytidine deaminase [Planctomycetota bacterium]|jgi:cytidine deaminase|nr:cytidine deaminase [Planctomycetota bacterium]MDP6763006.1 cytidine deaminase [Planctomycetota bacterium]MDP6990711.1 cytidine deaminase [Planctomycetota bacterium]